jgi:hypothetical protein
LSIGEPLVLAASSMFGLCPSCSHCPAGVLVLDVLDPHERARQVLDRVADRRADLLALLLTDRALAQLVGQLVGLLDQRQMIQLADITATTRPQPARSAAWLGLISIFRARHGGGVNRQPVEHPAEVQQQLAGITEPVGPRAVGLLERLGQPHFQPQLLQVERVALLRQRRDADVFFWCSAMT